MLILRKSDQSGLVGPSRQLWKNCPILDMLEDPTVGIFFRDMFDAFPGSPDTSAAAYSGPLGQYWAYLSQGGAIDQTLVGGMSFNTGLVFLADGDNESAVLGSGTGALKIASGGGKLWFEAGIQTSTISDTKHNIFVGLFDPKAPADQVPITSGDALADHNAIGFVRWAGDGDALDIVYKAYGQTMQTVAADAVALTANMTVNVGMYFDGTTLSFYVNGRKLSAEVSAASIAAVAFPSGYYLAPCFGIMNATATSPGYSKLKFWQFAQLNP